MKKLILLIVLLMFLGAGYVTDADKTIHGSGVMSSTTSGTEIQLAGLMMSSGSPIVAAVGGGGADSWGNTGTGSSFGWNGASIECSALGSPSDNATVGTLSHYSANSSSTLDIKMALYESDGSGTSNLVSAPQEQLNIGTWTAGWHDYTLASGVSVLSANSYYVCFQVNAGSAITQYYTGSAVSNSHCWDSHTYADAWPDPSTTEACSTNQMAFKAFYSW